MNLTVSILLENFLKKSNKYKEDDFIKQWNPCKIKKLIMVFY